MINSELWPGMRVETGDVGTEDYDAGRVISQRLGWSSGNTYWQVSWDSGARSECLAYQLRREFATCVTDGCNHGNCVEAARESARDEYLRDRENDLRIDEARGK